LRRILKPIMAAVLMAVAFVAPASADEAHDRLAGRTIDVVLAFSNSGGGARFWGIFADALHRQLPDTLIRTRFNDAGSGTAAASELFAEPEGALAVGFVRPAELAFAQAQGREDVDFDIGEAHWIVSVERETHFIAARAGLPLDIAALRAFDRQLIIPTNAATDTATIVGTILNAVTGVPARLVVGFNNAERLRAIVSGDADFYTETTSPEIRALLEANEIEVLYVITGDDFPAGVDHARTLDDVALPDVPRSVLDYVVAARALGRSFYAPPGVSPEDVAALRQVFEDAMRDPQFIADAQAQGVPIAIVPGDDTQAMMNVLLLRDPAQKAAVERAYECGRAMADGTLDRCDFGE
jgi:tripartite-type tricarboxylate transporter receptor subunit TctC